MSVLTFKDQLRELQRKRELRISFLYDEILEQLCRFGEFLEQQRRILDVLGELRQADHITNEECKRLQRCYDISDVVDVQKGKSPEVMSRTAEVLRRHGFDEQSRLLAVNAVHAELQQADLITSEECKRLQMLYDWLQRYEISDVVDVQKGKSPEVIGRTAEVLRRHGFEKESILLAVLGELEQADLITSEECKGLQVQYDISDVVDVQKGKSPEVMSKSAEVLRRHGFDEESKLLADLRPRRLVSYIEDPLYLVSPFAIVIEGEFLEQQRRILDVLVELQQADLITSEECKRLQVRYGISDVVDVQKGKSPEVMSKSAEVLRRHGFEKVSKLLAVLVELRQADVITSKEFKWLYDWLQGYDMSGVVDVQKGKSPEVMSKTAEVLRRHGFEKESRLLADLSLLDEERRELISDYVKLKSSIDATAQLLPKCSRHLFWRVRKAVFQTVRMMHGELPASEILDARRLRQQIQALNDPELLQQLSSYEENSLKPFIVTFLNRCREAGVQPDSFHPDVCLSPSTPPGQVLGFILSRKDYYIRKLHIDREHFSPWDVGTPPPARVPPTLNEPDYHQSLDGLISSYSALFTKVVENVETLPRQQYLNLKSYFQYQPHTEVHLPSSRRDVRDRLHHTPLFAPLCTALLWVVVWFLFTREADDLSHKLGEYEKKLVTFVSQFLRACHVEGVVPPTGDMTLHEDGCDLSDPAHLLACVLALKPYYVVCLHVDESLFTALERELSLEGEGGREENVSIDASPPEPTPPTSESESPGSFSPPQFKGKGKQRVGTSPSAVPAKRSAQGEGREDKEKEEDEEEEAAGSSAKRRRREESHMTDASQSGTGTGTDSGGSDVILSQMVYAHPDQLKLFREWVSRAAADKGRAVLEGVGLKSAQIIACFRAHPLNEEEGIQTGLIEWSGGQGHQPPTWAVLLKAMSYAKVAQEYIQGLETDLGCQ